MCCTNVIHLYIHLYIMKFNWASNMCFCVCFLRLCCVLLSVNAPVIIVIYFMFGCGLFSLVNCYVSPFHVFFACPPSFICIYVFPRCVYSIYLMLLLFVDLMIHIFDCFVLNVICFVSPLSPLLFDYSFVFMFTWSLSLWSSSTHFVFDVLK